MASENLDSAYHILSGIDTTRIMAKADRIYYQLIEIQLLYRMRKPADNMEGINECVSYYAQERKDVRKLAQAYYYRGMLEYESGKVDKAVTSLKKAEEAARQAANAPAVTPSAEPAADNASVEVPPDASVVPDAVPAAD